MSLLEIEDEAPLLHLCTTSKLKAGDIVEALGLVTTEGVRGRAASKFTNEHVKELNKSTLQVVKEVTIRDGRSSAEIKDALPASGLIKKRADHLAERYGAKIWGREHREHLLNPRSKSKYGRTLYWDRERDRNEIKVYIRCWIIKRAAQRLINQDRPEKKTSSTAKELATFISFTDDEVSDDESAGERSSPAPATAGAEAPTPSPFQIPRARMYTTPLTDSPLFMQDSANSTRNNGLAVAPSQDPTIGWRSQTPDAEHVRREQSPTSPGTAAKRKREEARLADANGKLPKVGGWKKTIADLPRRSLNSDDLYTGPHSQTPSAFGDNSWPKGIPRIPFGRRRQREDTQDSDPNWTPSRSGSMESIDVDAAISEHIDHLRQTIRETESQTIGPEDPPAASPSLTSLFGPTPDSVIPDEQGDVMMSGALEVDDAPNPGPASAPQAVSAPVHAPLPAAIPEPSRNTNAAKQLNSTKAPSTDDTARLRRELFVLLLSYIHTLDTFSPTAPREETNSAEDRMNHLLYHFWEQDKAAIRDKAQKPEDFDFVARAFEKWMAIRTQLQSFRSTTGFAGHSEEEWKAHLRCIASAGERAKACIALASLQDCIAEGSGSEWESWGKFNDALCILFDSFTMFKFGNRKEEFVGIGELNKKLFGWIL